MRQFANRDAGRAFFEAIPALFAVLEERESEAGLSALHAPFGAILSMLQLGSGVHTGFYHADAVLGVAEANSLRNRCVGAQCQFRGRHFTIHASGLFDSLSKGDGDEGKVTPLGTSRAVSGSRGANGGIWGSLKNGNGICDQPGDCFGWCGPGCFNPGGIWTGECRGHDLCVCMWSHASCSISVPDNCPGCNTLGEAVGSFIDETIRRWFESEETEEEDVPEFMWW